MKNVIIYSFGLIAELYYFYFSRDANYKVVGFTNSSEFLGNRKNFFDLPVVPFEEIESFFDPAENSILIAVGYLKHNKIRARIYQEVQQKGYDFITYVSPKATYYGSEIGAHCFIFEDNTIQPYTKIGNNVIIWSGNHIGHHSTIGDHCFISSHVVISGNCHIENNCFLGVNSTLRDGITIGEYSVIGAGALVMEDVPPHSVVLPEKSKIKTIKRDIL